MFDAPNKHQQVWFLRRFGPEVNLSNIGARDVLGVETLRLGLRSDTLGIGQ
jgi:phosphosulfolactate synthase